MNYSGYSWIKISPYKDDENLSFEERFLALQKHHIEETEFLIAKVRELDFWLECYADED
jgi:hypothetical protein